MKRTVYHNRIEYEEIIWTMGRRKANRKNGPCIIWFDGNTVSNKLPDTIWVTKEEIQDNQTTYNITRNGHILSRNELNIRYHE